MRRYTPKDVSEMQCAPGFWPVSGAAKRMRGKPAYRVAVDKAFPVAVDTEVCGCRWMGGTTIDSRSCPIHTEDEP